MERVIIAAVPSRRAPAVVRYAATLAILAAFFGLRLLLGEQLRYSPLLLFIPAVFISALLFDKWAGILATVGSVLLAAYYFIPPLGSFALNADQVLSLVLFLIIGLAISAVVEGLRHSVATLRSAERQKSILLEEAAHRTKNDLTIIASLLAMQARAQSDEATRSALEAAVGRVHILAQAQDRFRATAAGGPQNLAAYVEDICNGLGELLRGVRPIAIRVRAEPIELGASEAVSLGLIDNELVTNALKYAFPDEQGGVIDVAVQRAGKQLRIVVADDGAGCPQDAAEGLGSRLVRMLAAQLGGKVVRRPSKRGCIVEVSFPLASDVRTREGNGGYEAFAEFPHARR